MRQSRVGELDDGEQSDKGSNLAPASLQSAVKEVVVSRAAETDKAFFQCSKC